MLLVVMKNVLRSGREDTLSLVKEVFLRRDIKRKIDETAVSLNSKANKLLYFTMKHPNSFNVSVTKAIINYYDKKTNRP